MKERINKKYRPAELEAAIKLLQDTDFEAKTSEQILVDWFNEGWRLVKVNNDQDTH